MGVGGCGRRFGEVKLDKIAFGGMTQIFSSTTKSNSDSGDPPGFAVETSLRSCSGFKPPSRTLPLIPGLPGRDTTQTGASLSPFTRLSHGSPSSRSFHAWLLSWRVHGQPAPHSQRDAAMPARRPAPPQPVTRSAAEPRWRRGVGFPLSEDR